MKLFVDDVRDPVGEGFTVVRQYKQAVLLLDLLEFDFISRLNNVRFMIHSLHKNVRIILQVLVSLYLSRQYHSDLG